MTDAVVICMGGVGGVGGVGIGMFGLKQVDVDAQEATHRHLERRG